MSSCYERVFDIPIGPQHPALKEPALLRLKLDGEHVVGAEVDVSYNHRGIEKAAEYRTYIQNLYLIERVCGICNVAQTLTYCLAVEGLHGKEIPPRANLLRVLAEEISRINSHLLWLGVAAHEMGFDTYFMHVWLDREITLEIMEDLSGNRITSSYNVVGGVRRDISDALISRVRKGLDELEPKVRRYREIAMSDRSIIKRTQGVGILTPSDAASTSAVGPTLRASGIKSDVRADDPYSGHETIPFNVVTSDGCDAHARIIVRLDEILESIEICRNCLSKLPAGPIMIRLPRRAPQGEAMARVEAPRGELFHYIASDGTDKPYRCKISTPTLANLLALKRMLVSKGRYVVNVADVPVILASIDPCFSCAARVESIGRGRN